jgi:hypothetical protein
VEYDHRTSHSCYHCGLLIFDETTLNKHEDDCTPQGRGRSANHKES